MLTGKTRYRFSGGCLVLMVEVKAKPKIVKVHESYAIEPRTVWRDADDRDLQELHEIELERAKAEAFADGVKVGEEGASNATKH